MSPAGQCVEASEHVMPQDFLTRVLQLPSLRQAISLYNHTKEHQYVGVAVKVAEAGVCVAASTALPLAGPLVASVGGWATLDQWACLGLDRIQEAAPIITRPTEEVVSKTREVVLCKLAGGEVMDDSQPHPPPPSTLTAALTTRATNTARVVTSSTGGVVVTTVIHCIVNSAHTVTDYYLPPDKPSLILDHAVGDECVGVRVEGLVEKWRRGVRQRVCALLQVSHDDNVNPDDFVITAGHLVELSRRLLSSWYQVALRQPYIGRAVQGMGGLSVMLLDAATLTHNALTSTLIKLHQVTASSPLGPVVMSGVARVKTGAGVVAGGVNTREPALPRVAESETETEEEEEEEEEEEDSGDESYPQQLDSAN